MGIPNILNSDEFEASATSEKPSFSIGFNDRILLVVSLVGFCILALSLYSIVLLRLKTLAEIESDGPDGYDESLTKADVSALNRAQRRARAKAIMKQQRRIAQQPLPPRPAGEDGDENEDVGHMQLNQQLELAHDETYDGTNLLPDFRNLSRRERQKVAKLTEKRERIIFDEIRRNQQQGAEEQAKNEKQERLKQKAKQNEQLRMQERLQKKEEENKANEQWLTLLSTSKVKISVKEWIKQLKQNRVYNVNDTITSLGCDQLSKDTIFERINELINEGRVAGICEHRLGIFIFLHDEELLSISNEISRRQLVSLSDVVEICQPFIET